jgi:hypothetical protein
LTARAMPGTQAQNVIWVAFEDLQLPPARTVGLALALAPELAPPDPPEDGEAGPLLPPQAASRETAAAAARPAVVRRAVRGNRPERGRRDRVIGDISAALLALTCGP